MQDGYIAHTGVESVDKLLSRGGIQSMMWSVSLILLALSLGGLLVELNIIKTIISRISSFVSTKGKLILMTALSSMGINLLLGEQYLSIILPGEAFKSQYDAIDVGRKEMTRILANGGAAFNALIPWGVSGYLLQGHSAYRHLNICRSLFSVLLHRFSTFCTVSWENLRKLPKLPKQHNRKR